MSDDIQDKKRKSLSKVRKVEGIVLMVLGVLLLLVLLWCLFAGVSNSKACGCGKPVPHTGDVQILLSWSNYNDLDIACIDPNGDKVWFEKKNIPSGGHLDIDMNAGEPLRRDPIENIYWPTGGAPKGEYKVILTYYARHDNSQLVTPYKIKIKYGDETKTFTGELTEEKQEVAIYSFTID